MTVGGATIPGPAGRPPGWPTPAGQPRRGPPAGEVLWRYGSRASVRRDPSTWSGSPCSTGTPPVDVKEVSIALWSVQGNHARKTVCAVRVLVVGHRHRCGYPTSPNAGHIGASVRPGSLQHRDHVPLISDVRHGSSPASAGPSSVATTTAIEFPANRTGSPRIKTRRCRTVPAMTPGVFSSVGAENQTRIAAGEQN